MHLRHATAPKLEIRKSKFETIAEQQVQINVTEKNLAFANSDPFYRQLRGIGLGSTFRCENFSLPADVGTFELQSGTITFLAPVNDYVPGAVFVGQGHFVLKPVGRLDDGIWYSEHRINELKAGTANSREDKRLFATRRYNFETVIGKNNHFFSRAAITFQPLVEGERVLHSST